MKAPYELGQYFTRNTELREKVYSFILNKPSRILEPSIGRGDLINYVREKDNSIKFDMYEIDDTINILNKYISRDKVIFGDFLEQPIKTKYKTIIGNPPYKRMKTKTGNLYIDFVSRCYDLLEVGGELVFIIPKIFFKKKSAEDLLNNMKNNGSFTHIYHPDNKHLFEGATVDVIVFRYCKGGNTVKKSIKNVVCDI